MPGRDEDMDWLYRDQESGDPTRVRHTPDPQPPTGSRRRTTFTEDAEPAGGRRRATFSEDGDRGGPQTRAMPPTRAQSPAAGGHPRPHTLREDAPRPAGAPSSRGPRPAIPTPSRPKRPVRRIAQALGLLVLAWVVFLVATPVYAWGSTTHVDAFPSGRRPADQPGEMWLLVGSDSREGMTDAEKKELGTGSIEGKRTDSMMLLYVPPSGKPALISIPRDSYVPIPGQGKNKINAAYAIGGEKLLIQTIEQNTGLRIDHYMEVGFGGFAGIIDGLGGVEICPKQAIKDHNSHLDIPAGCQNMDGKTALGYSRMRYADPTGDLGRMGRQREMIGAMVKKAASPMTVLDPFRWWGVNTGAAKALRTDRDTGVFAMAGLVGPLKTVSGGQGLLLMVPISNPNAQTKAGSSMLWDEKRAKEMFGEISRGDTSKLDRFGKI